MSAASWGQLSRGPALVLAVGAPSPWLRCGSRWRAKSGGQRFISGSLPGRDSLAAQGLRALGSAQRGDCRFQCREPTGDRAEAGCRGRSSKR